MATVFASERRALRRNVLRLTRQFGQEVSLYSVQACRQNAPKSMVRVLRSRVHPSLLYGCLLAKQNPTTTFIWKRGKEGHAAVAAHTSNRLPTFHSTGTSASLWSRLALLLFGRSISGSTVCARLTNRPARNCCARPSVVTSRLQYVGLSQEYSYAT